MASPSRGIPLSPSADDASRLRAADLPGLRRAVLEWFDSTGRALAFRGPTTPYGVLVAEVMAQQTQVSRVEVFWRAFMARFPTVPALASASPGEVVRAWGGLGYNRRALNLHRAARTIVERHGGEVPSEVRALEELPGVGRYTARAVAAIAFGRRVGAVDTNVRRVVGRVIGGAGAAGDGAQLPSHDAVQAAADALVDPVRPGEWTHALMDIGSAVCRPRSPECGACPLRRWCTFPRLGARVRGGPPGVTSRRAASPPFRSTRRWLRGRLIEALCGSPDGEWRTLSGPIGEHPAEAVDVALRALAAEGLVERDAHGRVRLSR